MRGATWTTHPRTRRTDDINQLASKTTQQSFHGEGPLGGDYESSPEGGPLGGDYESSHEGGPLGGDYERESSHVGGPLGGDYDDGHQPASGGGSSDDPARLQSGAYMTLRILCTHPEPLVPSLMTSHGRGLDTGVRGFSRGRPYRSLEPSVSCDGEDRYEDQRAGGCVGVGGGVGGGGRRSRRGGCGGGGGLKTILAPKSPLDDGADPSDLHIGAGGNAGCSSCRQGRLSLICVYRYGRPHHTAPELRDGSLDQTVGSTVYK